MIMQKLISLVVILVLISLGCSDRKIFTHVDYFAKKNPELRKKYTELHPTSIEASRDFIMRERGLVHHLKENFKGYCPNDIKLQNYLKQLEDEDKRLYRVVMDELDEIDKILTDSDRMFIFSYEDGDIFETGYLILNNNGEIKWRQIATTNDLGSISD